MKYRITTGEHGLAIVKTVDADQHVAWVANETEARVMCDALNAVVDHIPSPGPEKTS